MSHCFLGGFSPWAHPWAGIAPAAVRYEPLARFYPRLLHPKAQLQIAGGGEHTTGTLLGIPGPNVSPPPPPVPHLVPRRGWGVGCPGRGDPPLHPGAVQLGRTSKYITKFFPEDVRA